ncbi:uncharacterized protein LOC113306054 [Papaver somniferum]|uniref:uncharacterized protein LOC113306054 n=1 Tax=Papaver somniferum TaxID=3469 RepID=UPI000E6F6EE3|nr:uncharacterized protein LOC113306054 [Papaver somniferum]
MIKDPWLVANLEITTELWRLRNKVYFEDVVVHWIGFKGRVYQLIRDNSIRMKGHINNTMEDLRILNYFKVRHRSCKVSSPIEVRWFPPNQDEIMICCDGASLGNPGPTGAGVTFRDANAAVLGVLCVGLRLQTNFYTEVCAVIYGAMLARKWNFRSICVQSDSMSCIQAFQNEDASAKQACLLDEDIFEFYEGRPVSMLSVKWPGERESWREIDVTVAEVMEIKDMEFEAEKEMKNGHGQFCPISVQLLAMVCGCLSRVERTQQQGIEVADYGLVLSRGIIEDSQNPSFRTGKSFDIETVDVRYGFSYDPKNEDHRVGTLVITSFRSADLNVYSLKADIWKTSSIQFVHAPKGELQRQLQMPHELLGTTELQMCALGGALYLYWSDQEGAQVWLMKDYAVQDSWIRLISIDHKVFPIHPYFHLKGILGGLVLFERPGKDQFVYHLQQKRMIKLQIYEGYESDDDYDGWNDYIRVVYMWSISWSMDQLSESRYRHEIRIRASLVDSRDRTVLQPISDAATEMLPRIVNADNPSTSFAANFVHASTDKNRCSINRLLWTPSGRYLLTGSQRGEITIWNGQSFNFEMTLQAHDQAIRSMVWSHNGNWMVTGDDLGTIKCWGSSLNNFKINKSAHKELVCDLSMAGHGRNVKSVDCHPTKSLLASGGKDNLVKLWDAESGKELQSLHGHKKTVTCVKWNQNGNWLLTASEDQLIKLYDVRAVKELRSFRGHWNDVTALAWDPFHEDYFVSGSFDASIFHWLVAHDTAQVEITGAHENSVRGLACHPSGYNLCSSSNDHTTRFWCRNRLGDPPWDRFNTGYEQGFDVYNPALVGRVPSNFSVPDGPSTGPFATGLPRNEGAIPGIGVAMRLSMPFRQRIGGEQQRQSFPVSMLVRPPQLPLGSHPSLLAPGQSYHQFFPHMLPPQQQHHQPYQQQIPSLQVPPSNMPLISHSHLSRPPQMAGFLLMLSVSNSQQLPPMPGEMGMQGSMNQTVPPMPYGHMMDQMHSGSVPANALQQPPHGDYA